LELFPPIPSGELALTNGLGLHSWVRMRETMVETTLRSLAGLRTVGYDLLGS
jgi:hypothetical protein